MPPGRLAWYLYAQTLALIAIVLMAGVMVVVLVEFVGVSRLSGGEGIGRALVTAILRSFSEVAPGLPQMALVGAALAIHRMRRRHELAVIMQSTLSAPVLLAPVLVAGLTLGLFHLVALNHFGAEGRRLAQELNASAQAEQAGPQGFSRAVMVSGAAQQRYLFIDRVHPADERIEGIDFIGIDEDQNLIVWMQAAIGHWTEDGWTVTAPSIRYGDADSLPVADDGGVTLPGTTREAVLTQLKPASQTPLIALPRAIAFAESIGGPAAQYRMQMASLVAMPFLLGAVAFLAGAIMIAPLPMREWVRPVAGIVLSAMGIYLAVPVAEALGAAGLLAAPLAAAITPMACLIAAFAVLRAKGL